MAKKLRDIIPAVESELSKANPLVTESEHQHLLQTPYDNEDKHGDTFESKLNEQDPTKGLSREWRASILGMRAVSYRKGDTEAKVSKRLDRVYRAAGMFRKGGREGKVDHQKD